MRVQEDINAYRQHLEISYETFAKMLFLDANTVKRTLKRDYNPTLNTLEKYAAALGGKVVFLTPEAEMAMADQDASALRVAMRDAADQVNAMAKEVEAARQLAREKEALADSLTAQVDLLLKQLAMRDDMLNKLLNKYVLSD